MKFPYFSFNHVFFIRNFDTNFVLVAIFAKEGPYLEEWVDYHFKIGFTHIVLCDNNKKNDNTDISYVNKLKNKYPPEHLLFPKATSKMDKFEAQMNCYNDAYRDIHIISSDWVAFIDIDEFFTLNPNLTIDSYVKDARQNNCSILFLNWLCYGNNGHIKKEEGTVIERFPLPVSLPFPDNDFAKSFLHGRIPGIKDVHGFIPDDPNFSGCCTSNFTHIKNCDIQAVPTSFDVAWVRHYRTKSQEEYVQKLGKWARVFHPWLNGWADYNRINKDPPNVQYVPPKKE